MRAFKLKEEKSFIKVLKEPPAPKKKVNRSRQVYIGLFLALGSYFSIKIASAFLVIQADGQLELPKQTISFPDDIEIVNVFIEEGEKVSKGDTLFQYRISADANQMSLLNSNSQSKDWMIKDKINTEKNLELTRIKLQSIAQETNILESNLKAVESLLLLGVNEEYEAFQSLSVQVARKKSEKKALEKELFIHQNQLATLNKSAKEFQRSENQRLAHLTEIKTFKAPRNGTISDVFYEQNEICYKKEEFMTIHKTEGASITTYFNPEEILHVEEGDVVDIEFPDGTSSKGVIDKLLVSTYALPSEFQKKYEPTERNIVAEVVPLLKSDESAWNNFYKMDVKINMWRYDLF